MCQNCVASLFLLIFLTFYVVRDHEAMGSNPVTPTKGKTMKTSSFFIFCRKCVALPLFRRLSAALGLFKCFALAPPSLAVTPTIKNTHALFGVVCFLFARNKGFERCYKLKFFVQFDLNENKKTSGYPLVQPVIGISASPLISKQVKVYMNSAFLSR